MAITPHEIDKRFAPPATDPDRVAIKEAISGATRAVAMLIQQLVPGSREQSEAITHLEMAVSWAHMGVDRRPPLRRPVPDDTEAACLQAVAEADIAARPDRL